MELPDEAELLHLFEAHPTLLDPGVDRAYNTLTYEARCPSGQCRVTLTPGCSTVALTFAAPALALDLTFEDAQAMTVLDGDTFRLALPGDGFVVVKLRPTFGLTSTLRSAPFGGGAR